MQSLMDRVERLVNIFPYLFAINLDVGHVILEYSWDVHFWELIFAENNEKTSFTTGSVANYHQLLPDSSHRGFVLCLKLKICFK